MCQNVMCIMLVCFLKQFIYSKGYSLALGNTSTCLQYHRACEVLWDHTIHSAYPYLLYQ